MMIFGWKNDAVLLIAWFIVIYKKAKNSRIFDRKDFILEKEEFSKGFCKD